MWFSIEENQKLLNLCKDLRVTEVRDGMDWMGMHHYGIVYHEIHPLFRIKVVGIAKTSPFTYVPYQQEVPKMTPDEYTEWVK
jgi:4-hydroxy-4-methyl-2-oxoglutarate aldolase